MLLGSFVHQISWVSFLVFVFPYLLKKDETQKKLKNAIFLFLLLSVLVADLYQSVFPSNYYTFFGINKKFSAEDLKKQKNNLLRFFHPDKENGDNEKFGKVNELFEIFSNPKSKTILSIYDLYPVDLIALHFDKLSHVEMESYQLEKNFDIWVENYLILFLIMFILKESGIKNRKWQILITFSIGLVVLIELAVHRLYEGIITSSQIYEFIESNTFFDRFRTIEVVYLIKRLILSSFLMIFAIFVGFVQSKKSSSSCKILSEIINLKDDETEKVLKLNEFFKKKNEKLQLKCEKNRKTQALFFIVIGIYWALSIFDLI